MDNRIALILILGLGLLAILWAVVWSIIKSTQHTGEDIDIGPPPCICAHSVDRNQLDCDGNCNNKPNLRSLRCNCERGLKRCDYNCGVTGNVQELVPPPSICGSFPQERPGPEGTTPP